MTHFFKVIRTTKNKTKCLKTYFKYLFSLENIKKPQRNTEHQNHKPAPDQVHAVNFIWMFTHFTIPHINSFQPSKHEGYIHSLNKSYLILGSIFSHLRGRPFIIVISLWLQFCRYSQKMLLAKSNRNILFTTDPRSTYYKLAQTLVIHR